MERRAINGAPAPPWAGKVSIPNTRFSLGAPVGLIRRVKHPDRDITQPGNDCLGSKLKVFNIANCDSLSPTDQRKRFAMRESGEEFWLIWFPCILAAVVISALYFIAKILP